MHDMLFTFPIYATFHGPIHWQVKHLLRKNMKLSGTKALPILLLVLVMTSFMEQGNSHPCANTFISTLVQLIPCRPAVSPFSPIPPSEACCTAIKALGQPCLCVLINGPPIAGIDRNVALQLPDKCIANFEPCIISPSASSNSAITSYSLISLSE